MAGLVLLVAGFLVWGLAGVRIISTLATRGASTGTLVDLAAWLCFLAGFLLRVRFEDRFAKAALLIQTVCGVHLAARAGGEGMEVALLVMVAGQLPGPLGERAAVLWVAAQTLAVLAIQMAVSASASLRPWSWRGAMLFFGSYTAFQLFALGIASLADSERRARAELARAHEELSRMQAQTISGARHAERLRIARDLHDALGHRLTALSLTLEAARHGEGAQRATRIEEARAISSGLLGDLRRTVTEIRDDETIELRSLLLDLGRDLPRPRVVIDMPDGLRITNPETVSALHRIGQEAVTNAARHSSASELRVRLRADDREVRFEVTDDGAALSGIAEGALGPGGAGGGYGLAGIEERARLLGGEARAGASARGGFEVSITFPASRLT